MAAALAPPEAPIKADESSPRPTTRAARRGRRYVTPSPRSAVWNRSPWKWLFSLRVGLVLLAALAVASTIGTLIDPLERAQAVVYYTWWFKLLLLALTVNMGCATYQTLVQKVLPSIDLRLQTSPTFYENARPCATVDYAGDIADVAARFRRQGCSVRVEGDCGAARTGWIGRLGGPISHAGLVIVLLSGFAASWVAREGVVRIAEGRSTDVMTLRGAEKKQVPLGFTLAVDDFSTGYFPRTRVPSHFESRVTATSEGEVLYSGMVEVNNSPLVGGWRLHQTSYEQLQGGGRRTVLATPPGGDPVAVEVSPGQTVPLPGVADTTIALDGSGAWSIRKGSQVAASGSLSADHGAALTLRAERFEPDFVLGEDRQIASRSQDPNNPALLVTLSSDGAPAARQWLFGREDMKQFSHGEEKHFRLELVASDLSGQAPVFTVDVIDGHSGLLLGRVELGLGEETSVGAPPEPEGATPADASAGWTVAAGEPVAAYATVLTLTRNPAIPAVYAGCGLMMLGLVLGFFVRRRDVWFMVDRAAGKLRVVGHYRHQADELDAATASLLASIDSPAQAKGAVA